MVVSKLNNRREVRNDYCPRSKVSGVEGELKLSQACSRQVQGLGSLKHRTGPTFPGRQGSRPLVKRRA